MDKQAILTALDIPGYYAAELASLGGEGTVRTAHCPFHDGHLGTLKVNTVKGYYRCTECGAKGGLITFHMNKHHLDFRSALTQLAERAGHRSAQPKSNNSNNHDVNTVIESLNTRHFVVQVGGKAYIATEKHNPVNGYLELELGSMADFRLIYSNKAIMIGEKSTPISTVWLSSMERRQYEGIVFAPGQETPGHYNMWQGFNIQPQQGNCCLFWQHLFTVICNGNRNHYWYVRKWLAHLVQKPAEMPGVAIVIRGKQGTGKTILSDQVGSLVGQHFLMLTQMAQLTGRFTGHLKDALLVVANEAVWAGDKHGEGALKSLITDTTTPVEMKGKDLFTVTNYKRLIVTTNEQWSVPMGMDDRRFLVLEASDARKEDKLYFKAFASQMANGGSQALMYDLLHEDLEGFDVRTKPHSDHGFDIKLQSAEPVVMWWFERLYEGLLGLSDRDDMIGDTKWEREPSKAVLHAVFIEFCKTHRLRTLSPSTFGKQLIKMMPGCSVGEIRPGGAARGRRYTLPELQKCREAFERFAKAGTEIWQ